MSNRNCGLPGLFIVLAATSTISVAAPPPQIAPSFPLPAAVQTALVNAPTSFGEAISGAKGYASNIIKTKVITFAKGSQLVFDLDPTVPPPPFLAVVAETAYIEGPQKPADAITITYRYTKTVDGARGLDGTPGADRGANGGVGGTGSPGHPGANGSPFLNLPPVYILFENIRVSTGIPQSSGLIDVSFNASQGGRGGDGGTGGKGGTGGRGSNGSSGRFPIPYCTAGPGNGSDSGVPGVGGANGDGSPAGNGADIHLFGPQAVVDILGFFVYSNEPGHFPGIGGYGGACGAVGIPGGPGSKPSLCPNQANSGNATPCPGPAHQPPGNSSKVTGQQGSFSITVQDIENLF